MQDRERGPDDPPHGAPSGLPALDARQRTVITSDIAARPRPKAPAWSALRSSKVPTRKDRVEGQAWARLLAEKHDPEVDSIIGDAVKERSGAWYTMVTRAVARGELPDGTDPRLLLGMLGAVVDAWNASSSGRLKADLLEAAVRTVVAGARSGSLVRSSVRRGSRPAD